MTVYLLVMYDLLEWAPSPWPCEVYASKEKAEAEAANRNGGEYYEYEIREFEVIE